jgi:hypothetical protein
VAYHSVMLKIHPVKSPRWIASLPRYLAVSRAPGASQPARPACSEMPARLAAWLPDNFTIFVGTSGIQRPIIGRAVIGLDVR